RSSAGDGSSRMDTGFADGSDERARSVEWIYPSRSDSRGRGQTERIRSEEIYGTIHRIDGDSRSGDARDAETRRRRFRLREQYPDDATRRRGEDAGGFSEV